MAYKSLILALLLGSMPATGYAQNSAREQGDKLCRSDVARHCRKVMDQGDAFILQCLQTNAARLSQPCKKFLQQQGQL